MFILKAPWNLSKILIISLERVSDGAKATPSILTGNKYSNEKQLDRFKISHIGNGLAEGTKSFMKEFVSAVAGVVIEPIK
jgi:hypothetical protein